MARQVDWVYDFALPPLVLHALYTADAAPLRRWLEIRPHNAITVLDTHDGIGVVDVGADRDGGMPGLLAPDGDRRAVETIHGAAATRAGSRAAAPPATSTRTRSTARSTTRSAAAIPSTSSRGPFSASCRGSRRSTTSDCWPAPTTSSCCAARGEGRDINRHYYTPIELQRALAQPVVQSLLALLRMRNTHAAFQGAFHVKAADARRLALVWEHGTAFARLDVDLTEMEAAVTCSADGASATALVWCSTNGATQGEDR